MGGDIGRLTDSQRELIENNIRLVYHIAKRYSDTRIRRDEFISAGHFGLVKAARTYNPEKGTKFTTYAGRCIINSILDLIADVGRKRGRFVSISDNRKFENCKGAPPTMEDLLDDGVRIEDDVIQHSELEERRLIIGLYLLDKSARTAQIIKLRLRDWTNEMIAGQVGISKSYVSRILTRIEKELASFKRKFDLTEGQLLSKYSKADIVRAVEILKDDPSYTIQVGTANSPKSVLTISPSVNFLHRGLCLNSDLIRMISAKMNLAEVLLIPLDEESGLIEITFDSSGEYIIRTDDTSALISGPDLMERLQYFRVIMKRYSTCYYDNTERTLYVKVDRASDGTSQR